MASKMTHAHALSIWLLVMRIALGGYFISTGAQLIILGGWEGWLDIGGILPSAVSGPFAGIYASLWQSPVILYLVIYGSFFIGSAFLLGCLFRLAALCGALMMTLMYTANVPPEFGPANTQLLFLIIFILFYVAGTGDYASIDQYLRPRQKRFPILRNLLG